MPTLAGNHSPAASPQPVLAQDAAVQVHQPKLVYLDQNVFGNLEHHHYSPDDVDVLGRAVDSSRIQIPLAPEHLIELLPLLPIRPDVAARKLDVFHRYCVRRAPVLANELVIQDVRLFLGLPSARMVFHPPGSVDERELFALWDDLQEDPGRTDRSTWEVAQEHLAQQDRFRAKMRTIKEEAETRRRNGEKPTIYYPEFREQQFRCGAVPKDLAIAELRALGGQRSRWRELLTHANQYPAFRMLIDVHVAYFYALMSQEVSAKTSFGPDLHHSIYAARADAFVTDDGGFRRVLAYIPEDKRCPVFDWAGFIAWLRLLP